MNSEFLIMKILNLLLFLYEYEYCKDRLNNDGSDYDNGDSELGIDIEEDNLFDNNIYGCEIQLFKKGFLDGPSF